MSVEAKNMIDAEVANIKGTYETVIYKQRGMLEELELKRTTEVHRLEKELVKARNVNAF